MVGNVTGLVESMHAADNARASQASSGKGTTEAFSDYLDTLLLSGRTGLFSGEAAAGISNSAGSLWQMAAFEALKEKLKKEEREGEGGSRTKDGEASLAQNETKKTEWAKIRVIERYRSPAETSSSVKIDL